MLTHSSILPFVHFLDKFGGQGAGSSLSVLWTKALAANNLPSLPYDEANAPKGYRPAPTASGHIEPSTLKKRHAKVFRTIAENSKKKEKPVRPFLFYDLRHTFLTRLGESGCDVWTMGRIAGHSSITMSSRYVHPGNDAVVDAMLKIAGGHKIGHSAETIFRQTKPAKLLTR